MACNLSILFYKTLIPISEENDQQTKMSKKDKDYRPTAWQLWKLNKKPDRIQLPDGISRKQLLSETTAAATRWGLSSSQHLGMVASTVNAAGGDMLAIVASPATVKRKRKEAQKVIAKRVKREFITNNDSKLKQLHWDGKVTEFYDEHGTSYEDCNAVVISIPLSEKDTQFIGAPVVSQGTGEKLARASLYCAEQWDSTDDLFALVFDTTSSNMGVHQGAAVYIEEILPGLTL